jgi:hypothetical protein
VCGQQAGGGMVPEVSHSHAGSPECRSRVPSRKADAGKITLADTDRTGNHTARSESGKANLAGGQDGSVYAALLCDKKEMHT